MLFSCSEKRKMVDSSTVKASTKKQRLKYNRGSEQIVDADVADENQQYFNAPTNPYATTNKRHKFLIDSFTNELKMYPLRDSANYNFVGAINFSLRRPNYVVIHHTAQNSCDQTLNTFTVPHSQVSAHYVICRNGTVYHMLNDMLRAWHGGNSRWGSLQDINSSSIGIELDNNGSEVFSRPQINALLKLLKELKNAYAIPKSNFIGHSDIAPTRKNDPSKFFPWKELATKGYGNWYDTTNLVVPNGFKYKDGLRLIGYDVRNESAAIKAFKLHYNNKEINEVVDKATLKMIYSLSQMYE
jgi:N-acetylmuramoyl-L-alanine amidase